MNRAIPLLLSLVSAAMPTFAQAGDDAPAADGARVAVELLPGESRSISHAHSASRDTALLAYQVLPHVVLTTGADFAVLGFRFSGIDLRAGMFGMIEVQTTEGQPLNFLTVPAGPYIWRGLLGYSVAVAPITLARRWLGPRGAIEGVVSFRHESEHFTGSREGNEGLYVDVPDIGDFVMIDVAARGGTRLLVAELRLQNKFFLPTTSGYTNGPGADLVFRLEPLDRLHPFLAVFGEYLFGRPVEREGIRGRYPDNYLVRGLLGIVFVGRTADLQLFAAASVGHGKGLLAFEEELRIGWGIRIGFFKEGIGRRPRTD